MAGQKDCALPVCKKSQNFPWRDRHLDFCVTEKHGLWITSESTELVPSSTLTAALVWAVKRLTVVAVPGIPVQLCWSLVNLCETENLKKVKTTTRILNSIWRFIQTRQKGQWIDQRLIGQYQGPKDFQTGLPRHSLTAISCRKDWSFQMFTLERNLRGWKLEWKS